MNANDRLHALLGEFFGKLQGAEKIVRIGDRKRRHKIRGGKLGKFGDAHRSFTQRIGTVNMQMHEARAVAELVNVFIAVLIGVRARDHRSCPIPGGILAPERGFS